MAFRRTVIGSFPSRISELGLDRAIRWVIDLQLRYGIEIVTDGEQRGDLIKYFEQIPGLGRRSGRPAIVDRIKPPEDLDDFYKLADCRKVFSYLRELGRTDVKVKITITGPVTLGFTYAMGGLGPYSSLLDKSLYLDLAYSLIPIIEKASRMGCYVQVDEPGLTGRFLPPRIAGEILEEFFREIHVGRELAIHVCGPLIDVPGLYDALLRLDLDVLSLAFSSEKEERNLQIVSRKSLEDHGKKLGAGFISNVKAESAEEAFNRLKRISERVGVENISLVHPDCGFKRTPINVVEKILEAMKKASDEFMETL